MTNRAHRRLLFNRHTVDSLREAYDYDPGAGTLALREEHQPFDPARRVEPTDNENDPDIPFYYRRMFLGTYRKRHIVWAIHYGSRDPRPYLTRTNNGNDLKIASFRKKGT